MQKRMRICCLRDEAGQAIVEMSLLLVLFGVPLMLGTGEFGILIYDSIEVSNAAHAGAMFGMMSMANASDTSEIITVAQAEAADFGTNLTVTPTYYWACSTALAGTTYATQTAANTACTGSSHALEFVKVVTRASATPLIHCPGLPKTVTMGGLSIMEVEE
jgi:Flp pilus assembly protein TadG